MHKKRKGGKEDEEGKRKKKLGKGGEWERNRGRGGEGERTSLGYIHIYPGGEIDRPLTCKYDLDP